MFIRGLRAMSDWQARQQISATHSKVFRIQVLGWELAPFNKRVGSLLRILASWQTNIKHFPGDELEVLVRPDTSSTYLEVILVQPSA
jgi:hypothetical protein